MVGVEGRGFFDGTDLCGSCLVHSETEAGHGRIEERTANVTSDIGWLRQQHPDWAGLRGIVAISAARTIKKTSTRSTETRYYVTSLDPDPALDFAIIRRIALNMLKREPSKTPIKRKRLKAQMNEAFRTKILAC